MFEQLNVRAGLTLRDNASGLPLRCDAQEGHVATVRAKDLGAPLHRRVQGRISILNVEDFQGGQENAGSGSDPGVHEAGMTQLMRGWRMDQESSGRRPNDCENTSRTLEGHARS